MAGAMVEDRWLLSRNGDVDADADRASLASEDGAGPGGINGQGELKQLTCDEVRPARRRRWWKRSLTRAPSKT